MSLIDSDALIDLLRGQPEAVNWLQSQNEPLRIPGYVAIEIIQGCRDSRELRQVQKLVGKFEVVWGASAGLQAGLSTLAPYVLSHGLGGFDLLIASVALELNATLYTFNHKHFGHIPELKIAKPYPR